MAPEKALELVGEYARLTKLIKSLTAGIGASLDLCKGTDGKRDKFSILDEVDIDSKNRDKRTHLWGWYQPERGEFGYEWQDITPGDHGMECIHCYAAHLRIQQRKQARKDFGIVKRSISRSIT